MRLPFGVSLSTRGDLVAGAASFSILFFIQGFFRDSLCTFLKENCLCNCSADVVKLIFIVLLVTYE